MISKNRISQIRKLHAKKFRDESGLFLVEGYKSVEMLCDSDFAVEEIFATENALRDNDSWLKDRAITMVSVEEMSRISTMQTPPELRPTRSRPRPYLGPRQPGHHHPHRRLVRHPSHRLLPRLRGVLQPENNPGYHGFVCAHLRAPDTVGSVPATGTFPPPNPRHLPKWREHSRFRVAIF